MESLGVGFYEVHILQAEEVIERGWRRPCSLCSKGIAMIRRIDPCLLMTKMIEKHLEVPRASPEFSRVTTEESQPTFPAAYP